jgi:hypothetical protein
MRWTDIVNRNLKILNLLLEKRIPIKEDLVKLA